MIVFTPEYIINFLSTYNEIDSSLSKFIEKYEEIIKIDKKKPLFSLTERYSTFPKQQFIDRSNIKLIEKGENAWQPNQNNKNIIFFIKSTLNKVTDKNYKICFKQLHDELLKNTSYHVFEILIDEIIEKCIYDVKYHNIFIELCKNIWSNRDIHYNLVSIHNKDDGLYWSKNIENPEIFGPFKKIEDIEKQIYINISFKNLLIKKFKIKFIERNKVFEKEGIENDEYYYKYKKRNQSIMEFIIKLYLKKYIDISNLEYMFTILSDNKLIKEDIECLYNISKILNNTNFKKLNYYLTIIYKKNNDNSWDDRTKFFFDEIISKINKNSLIKQETIKVKNKEDVENTEDSEDIENIINQFATNKKSLEYTANYLNKKNNVCESIVYCYFENFKNIQKFTDIIIFMYKKKFMYRKEIINCFYNILKEYNDIIIDYPKLSLFSEPKLLVQLKPSPISNPLVAGIDIIA